MFNYLLSDDLKREFNVFGSFYNYQVNSNIFECRSTAVIKRKNNDSEVMDALFILANPGNCSPLLSQQKIPVIKDKFKISNAPYFPAQPDSTQYQIMRLMQIKKWNCVSIINLSDLRCGNLDDYKQILHYAEEESFQAHSIFSEDRKSELSQILKNNHGPIIIGWGANKIVKELASNALLSLSNFKIMGLKHKEYPYYYHPHQRLKHKNIEWLKTANDLIS